MSAYNPRDRYYRKAREKGLPSRAAFKLEELLGRTKLKPEGARVLDLGCAPGGWLAILERAVGPRGRVVGIDLAPCRKFGPSVVTLVADIREPAIPALLREHLGGAADLVTSDLSPKLTGIAEHDEAGFEELIDAALTVAAKTLRPGGVMVAKVFMGGAFKGTVERFRKIFERVEVTRVKATRSGSSELYIVARGFHG